MPRRTGYVALALLCLILFQHISHAQEPPDAESSEASVRGSAAASRKTGDDWLDWTVQSFQIAFFIAAGASAVATASVAWRTYFAAKKGWLSPVNAENRKRMMDRLAAMSNDLHAELSLSSPLHFHRFENLDEIIASVPNFGLHYLKLTQEGGRYSLSPLVDAVVKNVDRQLHEYSSDPFIPREIRELVTAFLQDRREAHTRAILDKTIEYFEYLHHELTDDMDVSREPENFHLAFRVWEQLERDGYGPETLPAKIAVIREYVHDYLERFDPLPKDPRERKRPSPEAIAKVRRSVPVPDAHPSDERSQHPSERTQIETATRPSASEPSS